MELIKVMLKYYTSDKAMLSNLLYTEVCKTKMQMYRKRTDNMKHTAFLSKQTRGKKERYLIRQDKTIQYKNVR